LTDSEEASLREVEVTTYRTEGDYSDQRHPDKLDFTEKLEDDLARRDFTINALAAVSLKQGEQGVAGKSVVTLGELKIIDPFGGIKDLDAKLIRAVGEPSERFTEDALRLMRAVRLAAQLDFAIEPETLKGLTRYAPSLRAVSQERIRDELVRLVMSKRPAVGMELMEKTGLLAVVLPEVAGGVGVDQNKHHTLTVFEHSVRSLQYAAQYGYSLPIRLAALFHDVGKPKTRRLKGKDYTFYAHDVVGARMTERILKRLKFSSGITKKVVHLVRYHMFYYDIGKVTEAGARRLLRRVGQEHWDDIIKLRIAERKGSGVPKAEPYRLRHLQFLVEKAALTPITTSQLAIGGNDLINELGMKPGPEIGGVLNALLAEVLDDPEKNKRRWLLDKAKKLKNKDPQELKALGEAAKDEAERGREDDIRRKYHV